MELEKQVCTLQQAEILVMLGIKRHESYFYWHFGDVSETFVIIDRENSNIREEDFPAFTVAELGVMLPERVITYQSTEKYDKEKGLYRCISQRQSECPSIYGNTEAEARAAALIYFIEKELLTPEECNQRLTQ